MLAALHALIRRWLRQAQKTVLSATVGPEVSKVLVHIGPSIPQDEWYILDTPNGIPSGSSFHKKLLGWRTLKPHQRQR